MLLRPPCSTLFPYTTLFRSVNTSGDPTTPWTIYHIDATDDGTNGEPSHPGCPCFGDQPLFAEAGTSDRKSTRLNSSHVEISYAVYCLKKKKAVPAQSTTVSP